MKKTSNNLITVAVLLNVSFSFFIVTVMLFVANTFFYTEKQIVNIVGGGFDVTISNEATHFCTSMDNKAYAYIEAGKLYIKRTSNGELIQEIVESKPIIYAEAMHDRNIIVYFTYSNPLVTASENSYYSSFLTTSSQKNSSSEQEEDFEKTPSSSSKPSSSSSSSSKASSSSKPSTKIVYDDDENFRITSNGKNVITINSFDIDRKLSTTQHQFSVENLQKIEDIEFSSLTNLIFINTKIKSKEKSVNSIYKANITNKIYGVTYNKVMKNMMQLYSSDTVYYQTENDEIFKNRNSTRLSISSAETKFDLLGSDIENNIYLKSQKYKNTIYVVNNDKKIRDIKIEDTNYKDVISSVAGVFLVYDNRIINIIKPNPEEIYFSNDTSFYSIVNNKLFLIDSNNKVTFKIIN